MLQTTKQTMAINSIFFGLVDFNGAITENDTFHIDLEEINNPPAEWGNNLL